MIKYIEGDLLEELQPRAHKVIVAHVCNNVGVMGKGFAQQLVEKYPSLRTRFKNAKLNTPPSNYYFMAQPNIYISNMVCMNGLYNKWNNPKPLDYKALYVCLEDTKRYAKDIDADIHMPKIGTGFARGNWDLVEKILNEVFKEQTITVWTLQ